MLRTEKIVYTCKHIHTYALHKQCINLRSDIHAYICMYIEYIC